MKQRIKTCQDCCFYSIVNFGDYSISRCMRRHMKNFGPNVAWEKIWERCPFRIFKKENRCDD